MRSSRLSLVAPLLLLLSAPAWAIEAEGPAKPPGQQPVTSPAEAPADFQTPEGEQEEDAAGYRYLPQTPLLRNAQRRQRAQAQQETRDSVPTEATATTSAPPSEPPGGGAWLFFGLLAVGVLGGGWCMRRLSYA